MNDQKCPACGQRVTWDETVEPAAWRHEHDSRWCELPVDSPRLEPVYPRGATNPERIAEPWQTNPELWK